MDQQQLINMLGALAAFVADSYNNLDEWEQSPGTSQMRTADCANMLKTIGLSIDELMRELGAELK